MSFVIWNLQTNSPHWPKHGVSPLPYISPANAPAFPSHLVHLEYVNGVPPSFNAATEKLVRDYKVSGGQLVAGWKVVALTADEIAAVAAATLRTQRVTAGLSSLTDDLRTGWSITITKESDLQNVADQIYATAASEIAAAGTLAQVKSVYVKQVGLLFRLIIYLFRVLR